MEERYRLGLNRLSLGSGRKVKILKGDFSSKLIRVGDPRVFWGGG